MARKIAAEAQWCAELTSRILCTFLYAFICLYAFVAFRRTYDPRFLLILIAESLTALFIIVARLPKMVNRSAHVSMVTVVASFYFILINLSDGPRLLPATWTTPLQLSGILFQITAKLFLGRSFGLRPANRGIVDNGPYRLVRHPIYFGYLLSNIGLLLSLWSIYNLAVFAFWFFLEVIRIIEEEKVLRRDAEYRDYAKLVHYRLIPLVF